MGMQHQDYNKRYLDNIKATNSPINDAQLKYGVELVAANNVAEGEMYWRVIGIHHLLPEENMSNHHVYIDALDENGKRVSPPAWVGWTWEGRQSHEPANPAVVDKPANELGTNIAMFKGQRVSVWIQGKYRDATDKSDKVKGIHIEHADEPLPDGRLLNTYGHHSFYVVYQWSRKTASQTQAAAPVQPTQPVAVTTSITPAATGNKTIVHYVLLGSDNRQANLAAATDYIVKFGVTVGSNLAEAKQAQKVTVLGSGISPTDFVSLQAAGCQVEIIAENVGNALATRVQSGQSFVA